MIMSEVGVLLVIDLPQIWAPCYCTPNTQVNIGGLADTGIARLSRYFSPIDHIYHDTIDYDLRSAFDFCNCITTVDPNPQHA